MSLLAFLVLVASSLVSLSSAVCDTTPQSINVGSISTDAGTVTFDTDVATASSFFTGRAWDFTSIVLSVKDPLMNCAAGATCTGVLAEGYNAVGNQQYSWNFTVVGSVYTIKATKQGLGNFAAVDAYIQVCQLTCAAGKYVSALACASCTAGNYCPGGTTAGQSVCTSGNYCGSTELSAQTQCAVGSYCATVTTQVTCDSGKYCPIGSTAQVPCTAGSYCATSSTMVACTLGQFCPASSTTNPSCALGSYCPNTYTETPCSSGRYCPVGSTNNNNMCAAGSYCPTPSTQIACSSGQYCPPGSTVNNLCALGSYCPTVSTQTACSSGQYCPVGLTVPQACALGSYCASPSIQTACTSGNYCPVSSTAQTICAAGFVCATPSSSVACTLGSFCPPGSTVEQACPLGNYCASITGSTPCTPGSYCDITGLTAPAGLCEAGYYCPSASTNSRAHVCTIVGSLCETGSSDNSEWCPAGWYCPTTAAKLVIPPGAYSGDTGQTSYSTSNCPAGAYCPTPDTVTPIQCPPGYFCAHIGLAAPSGPCAAGYYCTGSATTASNYSCSTPGTFCPPASTNGTTLCATGYFCPNTTIQLPCPAGNYCPSSGLTAYTVCPMTPVATFCSATGMSLPVTCTAGFYCNATGLTVESGLCAAGYWCGAGSRSKFGLTNGAGFVKTAVGAGQRGAADGVGVDATSFNQPTAMTLDATGSTLYVADSGTGLLRRVQLATSTVNTLHLSSTLSGAEGLATFGDSLYVADTNCHRIFKVNISSLVSSAVAGQYPACSPTWNVYSTPTPDGVGTDVRFSGPKGIVVSPDGTYMYVADYGFNRIRNISLFASFTSTKTTVTNITNGTSIIQNITITSSTSLVPNVTVGTLAGGGGTSGLNKPGATDGLGGVALFNGPYGITIDPTGTILYVADLNNHAIRRIVIATTSVSTLAGNVNVPGYLDGVGTNAKLSGPTGIAIDSTGAILYVVDNFNQNLRQVMIDTRVVTTIAGSTLANLGWSDALGTSALFSFPTGVVILPGAVTMMVSDTMNNRIRKVDFVQQCQDGVYCPAGTSAVLASSCPAGTYCPAGSAPLDCPINTYCSASSPSSAGNSIGNVTTIAGSSSSAFYDGIGRAAMFFAPAGLVLNSQGDIIYVADSLNNRIRSVKLDTMAVSTLAGNGKPGFFDNVGRLAVLNNPQGITFDPTNTYLYFSDTGNHVIRRIWIATAQLITLAGSSTGLSGYSDGVGTSTLFNTPVGLIVDPLGLSIYVADQANNCIRSITILSLAVTTLVGNGTATFNDAIGTSAAMKRPSGLAMDSGALNLYFTDTGNHRIRQVNLLTRVTTTLAGSGVAKWADGVGTSASFNSPVGIALSPNDAFLFIADASNNRLRRISLATLAVTTISGSFTGSSGLGDGWGTSAVFNLPNGIAFDASSGALSTLYVADMQNNVVRKVQLTPAWCDPGFYCPLRSSMPNGTGSCAAGTYCNGVSTTPLICPAGLWCGAQTSSASGSGLCQTGYFCPAGSPNSTMFRCPLGTFCPPGSSAAFPCAAGSFCASSASQVACTAGSYCPASSTIMDACTPGSMCPTPTVQTVCAAGTYCPARSTSALPCPAGAYCPAGTSSANANICPFGTFCAPGSTAPSFCPIGSYCLNTTTQLICASGSFCPAYSTAPSACQAGSYCSSPLQQVTCSAGYYCPVSSTSQIICPVGRYCPAGSSSPSLVCPTGVFCPTGMTGIGGAGLCSPGSYCIAGSSSSTQAQCGGGFFCPAGSTAATGSGMCSQGYYCPVGSMNETGAGPCTAGYTCPIGSMYPTGRNMLRRDVCPAGYFCPAGSWVSVACRPGLFSPTTGAASCSFCPSGMFSNTTASTSCQPCPDKMFCLLGNPVPIPASYQQNTSQTVFNPFPLESIEANNQLTTITMSIASVMGAVFFCFVLFSVSAKRLLPRRVLQSFKSLDMLFGAAHVIEDGDYYRVYTTWLGGIFTLLTVCLILLVGALLTLQNTTVPTQTTDLSTAPPASDPLGYFAIEVGVFGSDLSTACANMSISQGAPGDWIGTVVRAKPVYTAKFNSCVVRWMCAKCSIGSRTLNPTFTLTSILPSWASFYNITLWTPALGGVGLLPFSVNQIFSPTATISDLSGFRSSATANDPAVKPSMVLQLTSFTVKTGSETNPTVRTTFQPSITSATSQPVNGPDIMDPSVSSTDLLKFSATAGFQLSLLLQRNTLNIVVNSVQPNIFNIIVLIGSASGSLISALAAVFKQLEPRVMKMQDSKPAGVETADVDEDAGNAENEDEPPLPKQSISQLPSQIVLERSRRSSDAPLVSVSAGAASGGNPYLWTTNQLASPIPPPALPPVLPAANHSSTHTAANQVAPTPHVLPSRPAAPPAASHHSHSDQSSGLERRHSFSSASAVNVEMTSMPSAPMPATIGSTRTAPPPPSSQPPPYAGRASTILPPVLGAGSADGGRPQSTVPAHGSSVKSGRAATRAMKAPSAPRANSAPRPGPPPPPTNA